MPFNPTIPVANSPVVSAELRNQFTSLKALIDALGVRVDSIQFPYTATGFGDPRANGRLTVVGYYNSQPLYQVEGGAYYYYATGYYFVQTTDPRVVVWDGVLYLSTHDTPLGGYDPADPAFAPSGTVS
jgi:hypothetical protein